MSDTIVLNPSQPFVDFAPVKPRRMSEKRYRELYDSQPVVVAATPSAGSKAWPVRITTAGLVSAQVVARTYHSDAYTVTVEHPGAQDSIAES